MDAPPNEASDAEQCVVCLVEAKSHLCVPCGHMCLCAGCVDAADAVTNGCPICRVAVREIVRVFK